jgi:A/G-specific adenine glycosylase
MDLGAIVCKPQNPLCEQCPFSSDCKALELNKISLLPVKAKKLIKKERYLHYFVMYDDEHIYIQQRGEQDIWKGLYEFPVEETKVKLLTEKSPLGDLGVYTVIPLSYKQTLTHQYIYAYFYEMKLKKLPNLDISCLKILKKDILNFAFPKIIRSYLKDRLIFLT